MANTFHHENEGQLGAQRDHPSDVAPRHLVARSSINMNNQPTNQPTNLHNGQSTCTINLRTINVPRFQGKNGGMAFLPTLLLVCLKDEPVLKMKGLSQKMSQASINAFFLY